MSDPLGDNPALAAILGEIRQGLELSESYIGSDRAAEEEVRAFRDGVPPPRLTALTVGRRAPLAQLLQRIEAGARGQRPGLTLLAVAPGDGLSHSLRWAQEQALSLDVAVAVLDLASFWLSPHRVQANLLAATRVQGWSLSEALYSGRVEPARETFEAVRALSGQLTKSGIDTVSALLEATAAGRTADAVSVLGWLQGEALDRSDRVRLRLPSDASLGDTTAGVVTAFAYLVRAFGARGLLVLFDARPISSDLDALARLPYALVVTGGTHGDAKTRVIELPPLGDADLVDLARRIRDRHLRAYEWQNASSVTDSRLRACLPTERGPTARDWVRGVVAALDGLLERDARP